MNKKKTIVSKANVDMNDPIVKSTIATTWATVAMAIFAFITLFVSIAQWGQVDAQRKLLEEELHRTHRPWLSIQPDSIEIVKPLFLSNKGYTMVFKFKLKNAGTSPAMLVHVWTDIRLVPPEEISILNPERIFPDMKNLEVFAKQYGSFILPGEEKTNTANMEKVISDFKPDKVKKAYLLTEVVYRDEFNLWHKTQLLWSFEPEGGVINAQGETRGKFEITGIRSYAD